MRKRSRLQKHISKRSEKLAGKTRDWWDELSAEQLAAIRTAEAELDAGKGIPHSEVLKKLSKWL